MIKKLSFIIVLHFISFQVESQNWDSIRGGLPNNQIEFVLFDSVHNELLVSSKFVHHIGSLPARGIARWNGTRWDSLDGGINTHSRALNPNSPGGMAMSCIPYNGKLLVGGQFKSIGGINATSLALWDGNKWDSLPKRAFDFNLSAPQIAGFYKHNNLLYIYGTFTVIAGQPATGLATWDGTNFSGIVLPTLPSYFVGVSGFSVFNNEIYIAGGYFTEPTSYYYDVLKFDGVNWVSTTGGGLKGMYAGAAILTIYNNELYAGGHILISDGNPANHVMKWDGTQWHDVGFGAGTSYVLVRKLLVHKNKLWAIGSYYTAGYMPAFSISVYDGVKWCALQDTLDNVALTGTVYNDTIYIGGGFWHAGGDPHISYLAKLKDPNLYRSCNGVGIKEFEKESVISLYPNPVSKTLYISSDHYFEKGTQIEITNTLGQTVLKVHYANEIDVSPLAQGWYILKITTPDKQQYHSKFIKQ